jgi:hypothetical protein
MRHIFFIHSHITWLVSKGVIRQQRLAPGEVLFVCTRGYRPPDAQYECAVFPHRRWVVTWRVVQWFRQRRELALFIERVAGKGDFLWYLPHTGFPFFHTFVAHPRCRGFHLIEEGLGSYHTPEALQDVTRRTLALKPGWKGWAMRLWTRLKPPAPADARYLTAWGCSEETFPGYARRSQVAISGARPVGSEDIEAVLVFDNVLEARLAGEEAFFACLQDLIAQLAQRGHRTVHYKLHPHQYIDPRYTPRLQRVLRDNSQGVHFSELPADYCLELLAAAGEAEFYVFVSSVGLYAAVAGCRVHSMAFQLAARDARYKVILEMLPDVMRRRLVFL